MDPSTSEEYKGIKAALQEIEQNIAEAKTRRPKEEEKTDVTLVAVSKKQPVEVILEAYKEGQRDFGENYVSELMEKANDLNIIRNCPDIRWHFIGRLQSNKIRKLIRETPNIHMVQTVDSEKAAGIMNQSCSNNLRHLAHFKVMVQVNTSQETNKGGANIEEVEMIVYHILAHCHNLQFIGLMTIGSANYDCKDGPNPDYLSLIKVKEHICDKFYFDNLQLSFGMSKDYQHAIELGSSYIRVGEKIFGPRVQPNATSHEKEIDPLVDAIKEHQPSINLPNPIKKD